MTLSKIPASTPETLKKYLKGRSVAVVGLGKSGLSALQALLRLRARVFVSESRPAASARDLPEFFRAARRSGRLEAEFGGHTRKILNSELIIVSPGVEWELPLLRQARQRKIPMWGELEFGFRLTRFKRIAAITGTNGKSTTVSLLGDMARRSGKRSVVAGNIGKPLCDLAFSRSRIEIAVLEVSSYQLESVETFHAQAAAVLNLTNDHLHRHKTMQRYADAKSRVFETQGSSDFSILNADDPWCRKMKRQTRGRVVWISTKGRVSPGVYWDAPRRKIVAALKGRTIEFEPPAHLPGLHNIENSCAAIGSALAIGIPERAILQSLAGFKGVEHRIEKVRTLRGVDYINDSKGTNVDSTLKAVQSFTRPQWLILGGEDKGGSYQPLREAIEASRRPGSQIGRVQGALLIGEATPKIRKALKGSCEILLCETLRRAVQTAERKARAGEVVLLSPACASFDQFKNFEDRGRQFKQFVRAL